MGQEVYKLLWLKRIRKDLRIKRDSPMHLYCNKKLAIRIAHNSIQHNKVKYIEVDRHFIKEKLDRGSICIPYICLLAHNLKIY